MALLVLSLDFSIDFDSISHRFLSFMPLISVDGSYTSTIDFRAILARKQNAENAVDGDDISTIEKIPSLERTFADSRTIIPESIGTINQ